VARIVLRGRLCNIIVLNVHAPTEVKGDDTKDRFMKNWTTFSIIYLSTIRKFY
jgi:hypothetical protein